MKRIVLPEHVEDLMLMQRNGIAGERPVQLRKALQMCYSDATTILKYVPTANNVADIGCGLGIVDCHFGDAYKHIDLIDRDEEQRSGNKFGWNESANTMSFYSDMEVAEQLVKTHTTADIRVFDPDDLPLDRKYDLIFSLYSWCFHYEIAAYANWVRQCLAPSGICLVTCRTPKYNDLEREFKDMDKQVLEIRQGSLLVKLTYSTPQPLPSASV